MLHLSSTFLAGSSSLLSQAGTPHQISLCILISYRKEVKLLQQKPLRGQLKAHLHEPWSHTYMPVPNLPLEMTVNISHNLKNLLSRYNSLTLLHSIKIFPVSGENMVFEISPSLSR